MLIGSICSGGGIALHGLGTTVWGIEIDKAIAEVYQRNFPSSQMHVDSVEKVSYWELADVDAIIATPSCKNASCANSKQGETQQDKDVALAIARIISSKLPKFFILENVVGYQNFESLEIIKRKLRQFGYFIQSIVLSLTDLGIPQSRKRYYLLAKKNPGNSGFLLPEIKYDQMGWESAIADLINELPATKFTAPQLRAKGIAKKCLLRRVGISKTNNRAFLPNEPCFTFRAFGRKCSNHWNQANVFIDNRLLSITPKAALRFFGDKATADKIWLPSHKALAMEITGNAASWQAMQFLLKCMEY